MGWKQYLEVEFYHYSDDKSDMENSWVDGIS